MLIVLSPAKRLDFKTQTAAVQATEPELLAEAQQLVEVLRTRTPAQLAQLMGISDSLASLNAARYEQWCTPFTPENARPALFTFAGDVYEGLGAASLDPASIAWAQAHIRILSGLYGVLRALDLMQAYRLEMGTRLATGRGRDLYQFWGERIARSLNVALAASGERVLVNLASQEYFRSVDLQVLDAPVVQPVFEEWRGGRWKVIAFNAKRARGAMTRYAIDARIDAVEQLKGFDRDGYEFDAQASDEQRWVFRRPQGATMTGSGSRRTPKREPTEA